MPHLLGLGQLTDTGNRGSVTYLPAGPEDAGVIHLPVRGKAAVTLGDAKGYVTAFHLSPDAAKPLLVGGAPVTSLPLFNMDTAMVEQHPTVVETNFTHNEVPVYVAEGWDARYVDGVLIPTEVVWHYDSRTGITGDPSRPVTAVMIANAAAVPFTVAWDTGDGDY